MSRGFKFSLAVILIVVLFLFEIGFFPNNKLGFLIILPFLVTLPFLLVVLLLKNASKKVESDIPTEGVKNKWVNTLKITFQSVFCFSMLAFAVLFITDRLNPAEYGLLLPFAILIFIGIPTFILSIVFYLIEKR